MTPFALIVWALAAGLALIIVAGATGIGIAIIAGALKPSTTETTTTKENDND